MDTGILIGDPASPILWGLYLSDFDPASDTADVYLNGVPVGHLEQADDIVLFSMTPHGLQRKLDALAAWCARNFMTIQVDKTKCLVFRRSARRGVPDAGEVWRINGRVLEIVDRYKYVGVTVCSSSSSAMFGLHGEAKALKARSVADCALGLQAYTGQIPVWSCHQLYMALVDPHLTYGCETALDVHDGSSAKLIAVQHDFLRRMLALGPKVPVVTLFSKSGLEPLRFRRLRLALIIRKTHCGACNRSGLPRTARVAPHGPGQPHILVARSLPCFGEAACYPFLWLPPPGSERGTCLLPRPSAADPPPVW